METVLLVLAVVLLLAVLGGMYVLYGALSRVMTALGLEPMRAPKPKRSEASDEPAFEETSGYETSASETIDSGGAGVGAGFALGAATTPSAAAAGTSYDAPETDYPAAAADSGWTYEETPAEEASPLTAAVDPSTMEEETDPSWARGASTSAGTTDTAGGAEEAAAAAGVSQRPIDDEPEEQPFERDGRWWFKRGGELLVYDEKEGQWQPAPATSAPTVATNPTSAQAGAITAELASLSDDSPARYAQPETTIEEETPAEETPLETPAATPVVEEAAAAVEAEAPAPSTSSSEEPVQPVTEWQSGSFWKCPSCGAVNGSTAASCRMCFAARA